MDFGKAEAISWSGFGDMGDYDQYRLHRRGPKLKEPSTALGKAAVASVSRESTALALDVLRGGGNAFDAAFLLGFALAVCHPQAGNIGGGGYMLVKAHDAPRPMVYGYRERAPIQAKREDFLNRAGDADPDITAFGPRSVCVPGMVKAFFKMHARYGRLGASGLLHRVAELAREGAVITDYQAQCLNRLAPKLALSGESSKVFVREGGFKKGDRLPNPRLAHTLEELALEGEAAFYRGGVADRIVEGIRAQGGYITMRDLEEYDIREVEPIGVELDGGTVWSVPPEGGGAILLQILKILARPEFTSINPRTPDYYHYLAQSFKMAFIDRMFFQGDIDLEGNTVYENLLSGERASFLFGLISRKDISLEKYLERMGYADQDLFPPAGGDETTHFSVIDGEGNCVSNSYTLNLRYGSKWSVPGTGFLLNGSMDGFAFNEGKPNYFGVIGNRPNLFEPGKRPASNMAPLMVTSGKKLLMALGTPGGPTIPSALSTIILSIMYSGIKPEDAVSAGRIHHQAWPDVLYREGERNLRERLKPLEKMGYTVKEKNEPIGDVHGIFRREDGFLAVSDLRREGCAGAC